MRERPILMTPENAQKCHDGTKSQTRRIVKYNPILGEPSEWCQKTEEPEFLRIMGDYRRFCPYGGVGDRLWVRENGWERPARTPKMLRDGADTWERFYFDALMDSGEAEELKGYGFKRRPSIHMPRWACRTVLEMTEVRVERLQDISRADAMAEGFVREPALPIHPLDWYRDLWCTINGSNSWELNPWVWVIVFRKVGACGR